MTDEAETEPTAPTGESLQERVARRSRELEQRPEATILLPVPGYEDLIVAQYRPLTYRESVKIETRHEKNKDQADQLLNIAADKLIAASERLVEPTGQPDEYKDTGYSWKNATKAARECFSLTLPESASARQALLAIFHDEEAVVRHATEYEERRQAARSSVSEGIEGESAAGLAAS